MAESRDGQGTIITGTAQQAHEIVAELFPNAIPLVKRDAIYLIPIGHGDDQRFARNFRTTWRLMGKEERRRLTDYWRNPDPTLRMPQALFPYMELVDVWARRNDEVGCCTNNGRKFMFWAVGVDAMPDDMVQTLIAHELGHAFRHAIGRDIVDPANPPTEAEEREEEFQTRLLVGGVWGFDEEALTAR